jgi:hypothetical protein
LPQSQSLAKIDHVKPPASAEGALISVNSEYVIELADYLEVGEAILSREISPKLSRSYSLDAVD